MTLRDIRKAIKRLQAAIDANRTITFTFKGKERVLRPTKLHVHPSTGTVLLWGEEPDGSLKSFSVAALGGVR